MIIVYFIGYIFLLFAMNMSPENENELVTYNFFGFIQLYHNNLPFYKVSSIFKYFCGQGVSYLKFF